MDLNGKCEGWTNWATYRVILVLDNDEGYYRTVLDWVDECSEQGMTKAQARSELAGRIEGIVEEEFYDMHEKGSPLAQNLTVLPDWMNINFNELADYYLDEYSPKKGKTAPRSNNLKSGKGGKKPSKQKPKKKGGSKFSLPSINKSRKHRWDSTIWTTNWSDAP